MHYMKISEWPFKVNFMERRGYLDTADLSGLHPLWRKIQKFAPQITGAPVFQKAIEEMFIG